MIDSGDAVGLAKWEKKTPQCLPVRLAPEVGVKDVVIRPKLAVGVRWRCERWFSPPHGGASG